VRHLAALGDIATVKRGIAQVKRRNKRGQFLPNRVIYKVERIPNTAYPIQVERTPRRLEQQVETLLLNLREA